MLVGSLLVIGNWTPVIYNILGMKQRFCQLVYHGNWLPSFWVFLLFSGKRSESMNLPNGRWVVFYTTTQSTELEEMAERSRSRFQSGLIQEQYV